MKLCQKCGADVDEDAHYCDNCGISLDEYPPVTSGGDEGEQVADPEAARRKTRTMLIALFVGFDVVVAALILYMIMQSE